MAHTVKIGAGIGCTGGGALGPISYSVYDLGKPGVPKLSVRDARMLHAIMRYVHPRTLRFAYLEGGTMFGVMDMQSGPCTGGQVAVLSAPGCDMVTIPYDGMGQVFASSGCWSAARPWFPGERDGQHPIPWTQYDNNH